MRIRGAAAWVAATVRFVLVSGVVSTGAVGAGAAVVEGSIPFAPEGDSRADGALGQPVALTDRSFLVAAEGPDGLQTTADDEVLLVTGLGGAVTVTPLATPFLGSSNGGGQLVRLSASRAVVHGAGPDATFVTADDQILLLDDLGAASTVTPIQVPYLREGHDSWPSALSADAVLIPTSGPDALEATADDTVALVSRLGAGNQVTQLAAPGLDGHGKARPGVLSPTSFLVVAEGPDDIDSTADDVAFLFTDVGGTNQRATLAAPFQHSGLRPPQPVRVTATRAVLGLEGPDGDSETADDQIALLDDLGGANTTTLIGVPYLHNFGAGNPMVVGADTVAVTTWGADATDSNADDSVVVISDLGGANTTTPAIVGATDEDLECRPVRIDATTLALVTFGADGSHETVDDQVAIISDVGGANSVSHVAVPTLAGRTTSLIAPVSATSLLVANGGPDGSFDSPDDVLSVVEGLGVAPTVQALAPGTQWAGTTRPGHAPVVLGGGRAVLVGAGPDTDTEEGGDDTIQIIGGLPTDRALTVAKARVKFDPANPAKGEKANVKATLALDGAEAPGRTDLTVTIGTLAQTLPASALIVSEKKVQYKDKKNLFGPITKLVWKAKKGQLSIKAKGVATGLEGSADDYLPVAVEFGDFYLGQALDPEPVKKGLKFKAPKG